jgi:hypothetical protein
VCGAPLVCGIRGPYGEIPRLPQIVRYTTTCGERHDEVGLENISRGTSAAILLMPPAGSYCTKCDCVKRAYRNFDTRINAVLKHAPRRRRHVTSDRTFCHQLSRIVSRFYTGLTTFLLQKESTTNVPPIGFFTSSSAREPKFK